MDDHNGSTDCEHGADTCGNGGNSNYRTIDGFFDEKCGREAIGMEHQKNMSHDVVINCDNISKEFVSEKGTFKVVERFNLDVYENEFVVLFGPGQCGKTTLINIMAGLDRPTAGHVYQGGIEVRGPGPGRGVVYQSVQLFPWLTVMGNVEFGPKARGIDKATRQEKALSLIDLVGLKGFENAFPNSLSGGMRQRVGIARAYCNDSPVLLMDEPFGALDAQTRYLMEKELSRIHTKDMRTIVFVTNNIEEALYLADRIVVLRNCPTSVKKDYAINWPRPRDYTAEEFLALRQEITDIVDKTL